MKIYVSFDLKDFPLSHMIFSGRPIKGIHFIIMHSAVVSELILLVGIAIKYLDAWSTIRRMNLCLIGYNSSVEVSIKGPL